MIKNISSGKTTSGIKEIRDKGSSEREEKSLLTNKRKLSESLDNISAELRSQGVSLLKKKHPSSIVRTSNLENNNAGDTNSYKLHSPMCREQHVTDLSVKPVEQAASSSGNPLEIVRCEGDPGTRKFQLS